LVKRFGEQLFSGTSLPLENDGHVTRGETLEQRIEAAHLEASADEASESRIRGNLDTRGRADEVHAKRGLAHPDDLTALAQCFHHAHSVHERAVGRPEVGDSKVPIREIERRMPPRDLFIGEAKRARRPMPDERWAGGAPVDGARESVIDAVNHDKNKTR